MHAGAKIPLMADRIEAEIFKDKEGKHAQAASLLSDLKNAIQVFGTALCREDGLLRRAQRKAASQRSSSTETSLTLVPVGPVMMSASIALSSG